jgi:hypothetical protein
MGIKNVNLHALNLAGVLKLPILKSLLPTHIKLYKHYILVEGCIKL